MLTSTKTIWHTPEFQTISQTFTPTYNASGVSGEQDILPHIPNTYYEDRDYRQPFQDTQEVYSQPFDLALQAHFPTVLQDYTEELHTPPTTADATAVTNATREVTGDTTEDTKPTEDTEEYKKGTEEEEEKGGTGTLIRKEKQQQQQKEKEEKRDEKKIQQSIPVELRQDTGQKNTQAHNHTRTKEHQSGDQSEQDSSSDRMDIQRTMQHEPRRRTRTKRRQRHRRTIVIPKDRNYRQRDSNRTTRGSHKSNHIHAKGDRYNTPIGTRRIQHRQYRRTDRKTQLRQRKRGRQRKHHIPIRQDTQHGPTTPGDRVQNLHPISKGTQTDIRLSKYNHPTTKRIIHWLLQEDVHRPVELSRQRETHVQRVMKPNFYARKTRG